MKRVAFVLASGSLAVAASLIGVNAPAAGDAQTSLTPVTPDVDNLGRLIPQEEAPLDPTYHLIEAALDNLSATIPTALPDTFVESEIRDTHGVLYVKGSAGPLLRELVAQTGAPITVVDGLPFSRTELTERMLAAHDVLAAHPEVAEVATSPDFRSGRVTTTLTLRASAGSLTASDLTKGLPDVVAAYTDVTIADATVDLVRPEAAFGGMRMRGAQGNCTSGFTIAERSGTRRGIVTAAHCTGLNEIVHPFHAAHEVTHQRDHEGIYGDLEWHATGQRKPAQFYADSDSVRDVLARDSYPSINESVCGYGRTSDDPSCSRIKTTEAICDGEGSARVHVTLTYLTGNPLVGGDSGGPWYYNNKATGVHFGNCDGVEAFTKASDIYGAFGFDVAIAG